MGAGTSLSSLKIQKTIVKTEMADTRQQISDVTDKVKRLQDVSSSMQTSIQSLRNLKGNVDDFEVTKAKWEGEEEEKFADKYNAYKDSINGYASDTSKAKKQIEEDLEAARKERAQAVTGMEVLQNNLDRLEADIKDAKED